MKKKILWHFKYFVKVEVLYVTVRLVFFLIGIVDDFFNLHFYVGIIIPIFMQIVLFFSDDEDYENGRL